MIKNFDKKVRAYALKNALSHDGIAMQGPVISSLFNDGLERSEVKKYAKKISEIILEVNNLSAEEKEKEFRKLEKETSKRHEREGLDELPDADKKKGIIMRFRPAPTGNLHIGHIISNLPASLYVKKYGGKFYVIIDDTDPQSSVKDAYEGIKRDCDWIFGNVSEYLIASDRIMLYYSYAEKLIQKNAAYVCTCSSEKFKEFVSRKKDCPCRNLSVEMQMDRWGSMLDKGGFKEGEAVLRFKSDMKHKNPAMRDFPLARINLTEHVRQKKKYRVWPLMNLAVSVDDMELGMTHIIRGKDHMDNAERQKMIFSIFRKKFPWTFFMGRIKFSDLALSKRKIAEAIKKGEFESEEDIRLPTIVSLRKRGYKPEAFAKFIEQRGLSEVDKVMRSDELFELLDHFNREV